MDEPKLTPEIREQALSAALGAFELTLIAQEIYLDFPGRLAALEEALDELARKFGLDKEH